LTKSITILVGKEKKEFSVLESILCAHGEYFCKALNTISENGQAQPIMELPETEPVIFESYLYYNYFQALPIITPGKTIDKSAREEGFVKLAKLYVFGTLMKDVTFRNAVVGAFVATYCRESQDGRVFPDHRAINIIYCGTMPTAPLRRLVVGFYAFQTNSTELRDWICLPREFLYEVISRIVEVREQVQDVPV
jgi:hypothetical protein